ncbi:pyridoxamine 5'-phosphate oxidase family protein [Arcobacter arenosus]|jgi:nitroimidazol reductase NimA-like FMN-containing flavoprotein (pyridoxamine 5'-phosphate oxidase superfamily)|uniref:pyridoxamine 5'-phosphate oxidase family protein n=1 Tax=Arcobacter arenosus TaxID=2576037 RepID=UPI003BAA8A29
MKKAFEITNKEQILEVLNNSSFGTLCLCFDNKPYSIPLNFVEFENEIYFHGAKKGKKMDIIKENTYASFCVVEDYSLLPSYFSSDKGDACPATHLFKSVIINGQIKVLEDYNQKANALEMLMQKLQKEGKYIPLNNEMYKKAINGTCVYKLIPTNTTAKFKLGQNFNEERYQRVVSHLKQRGTKKDLETLELIELYKK